MGLPPLFFQYPCEFCLCSGLTHTHPLLTDCTLYDTCCSLTDGRTVSDGIG